MFEWIGVLVAVCSVLVVLAFAYGSSSVGEPWNWGRGLRYGVAYLVVMGFVVFVGWLVGV